jgi:4-amino-4-deoxy-L-arabinose transferase-like glycosyltransferase
MTVRAAIGDFFRTPRGQLLLLLVVAAVVRVAALQLGATAIAPKGDEGYYLRQGASIAQGMGHPGSFRPPLYPLLIGATFSLFGASVGALRWIQIVISLVAVGLLYDICRRRFGTRAAFWSGLACALSPALAHFSHFLWSETLFITLLLLFFWMLRRFDGTGSVGFAAGAGLTLALAALTKEIVVFFALLMLPWLLVRPGRSRRLAAGHALIFFACFLLPLAPWVVRNWQAQETFVGLSTCRWFPIATGNLQSEDAVHGSTKREEFLRQWRGMTDEVEKEAFSRRAALASIRAQQPWWILRKVRLNLPRLFSPKSQEIRFLELGLYPREIGPVVARATMLTSLAGHLLLVAPGLAGLWLIRGDPLKWLAIALIVYVVAVYVVANATPRFLVPLLPLFYLYVGPLVTRGFREGGSWRRAGALATVVLFLTLVLPQVPRVLGPVWRSFG